MNFSKSNDYRSKAQSLIPAGAHTYSKGDDQFPELSPGFICRGKGSTVWDMDGNQFLDWGMGLRSVCLGHAYEPVLETVRKQLELGVNFTRPSPIEAELAEQLVALIPCAEMVKFAKNGSDVTTAAVKLARAYTGRDMVLRCLDHPFFSVDDWFIGDTAVDSGIPNQVKELTRNFRYNDADSLEQMLQQFKGQVACVILEAATTGDPAPGFLERVRELTSEHGAVLIFDEIITGFRWHPKGAQYLYGVTPDIATFGKAMANGFSMSALVGRRDILELGGIHHDKPRVFLLSTTNGGETHSIAAALKTIELLSDGEIIRENWRIGEKLVNGFNSLAQDHGIFPRVRMQGLSCSPYCLFLDPAGNTDWALRTLFLQETIRHGVLMPYVSISASHRDNEVDETLKAVERAMPVLRQALDKGTTDGLLVGKATKPVFRKFN